MTNAWTALLWPATLFILLLLLKRWLSRHLQGLVLLFSGDQQTAISLYYLVLLPGIVLHELSHVLAAQLVGIKTKRISLRPTAKRGRRVRFGAVTIKASDPIRETWIGLAPLLTGSAIILCLARWQFGLAPAPVLYPDLLLSCLQAPDAWLWIYLVFAISNAMLPSESDRQPWRPILLFLALLLGTLFISGWAPRIPTEVKQWSINAASHLTLAFGLALGVDVFFAALIFVLEKTGERILHRHVEY